MIKKKNKSIRAKITATHPVVMLALVGTLAFGVAHGFAQSLEDPAVADDGTADQAATPQFAAPAADEPQTGDDASVPQPEDDALASSDPAAAREGLREPTVDGVSVNNNQDRDQAPGIPIGTMTFRPSISESMGYQSNKTGTTTTKRIFSQTGLKGSLTSDWDSNQLTVESEANLFKTFSGTPDDDPTIRIDALLRLDVTRDLVANVRAGYSRSREEATALNAIQNASLQAGVDQYRTGADATQDFGRLRATVGVDLTRSLYSAAILGNGKSVSQSDRDNTNIALRGRLGYELSPVLIPFIEVSGENVMHDEKADRSGYERDQKLVSLKAGTEVDLGEKLKGELAGGYAITRFEDARLAEIRAFTIDGNTTWSPRRGTDVTLGLKTDFEPATTAGISGAVTYALTAELAQAITEQLTGRINASTTWRNYDSANIDNQTVLATGAGLTWGLSRYLDLTADARYEVTRQKSSPDTSNVQATIGLLMKR